MRTRLPCLLSMWACLGACDADLPKISLVTEMEVFGHRVEVAGDSNRATPAPGEQATIEWDVIFPQPNASESDLSVLVIGCTFPERYVGRPICQELIDAHEAGDLNAEAGALRGLLADEQRLRCTSDQEDISFNTLTLSCLRGTTRLDFTVAEDFTADARLFFGIVCREGVAQLDDSGLGCEGNDDDLDREIFQSEVTIQQSADDANENPSSNQLTVLLDGEHWDPWTGDEAPAADDCDTAEPSLPTLAEDRVLELKISVDSAARERVAGQRERLRISHRATAGEFESSASYIFEDVKPDDDGKLTRRVEWTPPREKESEQVVHFFFGLRDDRGGFASLELFACRP